MTSKASHNLAKTLIFASIVHGKYFIDLISSRFSTSLLSSWLLLWLIFQLLDLPGIIEGAKDGKGRGRQVIAVARTCSLIFIVLDVLKPLGHKRIIERELEGYGIRLNKEPPNIVFRKKDKGGINLQTLVTQSELDLDLVRSILSEYKIHNADITLRYDATADDLIDVVEGNRIYIPCIYLLNKIDQITVEELDVIYKIPHCVPISAHHRWNFDDLLEKLWDYLQLLRM